MPSHSHRSSECRHEPDRDLDERLGRTIPQVVRDLTRSCGQDGCFDHVSPVPIPSVDSIVEIVATARRILFPGYFLPNRLDSLGLEYYLGQETTELYQKLSTQITWSFRHDCYRYKRECLECLHQGRSNALEFLEALPGIRMTLGADVQAALEGDPASQSYDQIIFSYPGLFAITVHRLAHVLYAMDVPLIPRIMSEYAHSHTGIDIHPGANIGRSFFIDHGTGVVIGETATIGDRVRLYQGVTLGALSLPPGAGLALKGQKRHPTIEDDVIIYAGATILGGATTIGRRSVIGGNVWLTESVPPDTKVILKKPELEFIGPRV